MPGPPRRRPGGAGSAPGVAMPASLIKLRDLVAMPHLRTRCLAGAQGLDRRVSWAHVYDVPDPWEWMAPGELVMNNGYGLPAGAQAQSEYVTRLDRAGAAGLAISEGHYGPQLTREMLATADRLAFPLLETAWEVAYATLARVIAAASRDQATEVLARVQLIYDALNAAAAAGRVAGALLADVAGSQGCTALVLDRRTGRPLMSAIDDQIPRSIVDSVSASMRAERRTQANLIRVEAGATRGIAISLPLEQEAMLVVCHGEGDEPDTVIMRHLATIAAGELARTMVSRGREQDRGRAVLAGVLAGDLAPEVLLVELRERGLHGDLMVVAVDVIGSDPELRQLYFSLVDQGITPLVLTEVDRGYVVIPSIEDVLGWILQMTEPAARVGVSETVVDGSLLRRAIQQARWSLGIAGASGTRLVRHADQRLAAFLPATVDDARQVVDSILGPVIVYDAGRDGDLVHSLRVFLRCNRSWQKASQELFVHRQTLVYRMRQVEELTGLRLDCTDDVTQLWLALRTRELLS
jgi:PucR family transcriptional regulator, purine catabolism regulatory protein